MRPESHDDQARRTAAILPHHLVIYKETWTHTRGRPPVALLLETRGEFFVSNSKKICCGGSALRCRRKLYKTDHCRLHQPYGLLGLDERELLGGRGGSPSIQLTKHPYFWPSSSRWGREFCDRPLIVH